MKRQEKGQRNFLDILRNDCTFNSNYPCTHYWARWTMREVDSKECKAECCRTCKEMCGYRCNACSKL